MKIIITYTHWTDDNSEVEKIIAVEYSSVESLKADMIADNLSHKIASDKHEKECRTYNDVIYKNINKKRSEESNVKNLTKKLVSITSSHVEKRPDHYDSIVSSLSNKIKGANDKIKELNHTKFGLNPIMNRPVKKFNFNHYYRDDLRDLTFYTLDEWFFDNQVNIN